jgi:hypothetical protein
MAWQKKVKAEVAEWWRWMRRQSPSETESAQRWAEENPDEIKELDRMLYRSAEKYYAKNISLSPADAEAMDAADHYPDPDSFLPEDVRDRIYDDKAWFVRDKYLPKDFEDDPALHLQKDIVDALHQLTELQREIIFRNIINGESAAVIAEEKNCSARNIRDIRERALKALRVKVIGRRLEGYGTISEVCWILFSIIAFAAFFLLFAVGVTFEPWFRAFTIVMLPLTATTSVLMFIKMRRDMTIFRVRDYWERMQGKKNKTE